MVEVEVYKTKIEGTSPFVFPMRNSPKYIKIMKETLAKKEQINIKKIAEESCLYKDKQGNIIYPSWVVEIGLRQALERWIPKEWVGKEISPDIVTEKIEVFPKGIPFETYSEMEIETSPSYEEGVPDIKVIVGKWKMKFLIANKDPMNFDEETIKKIVEGAGEFWGMAGFQYFHSSYHLGGKFKVLSFEKVVTPPDIQRRIKREQKKLPDFLFADALTGEKRSKLLQIEEGALLKLINQPEEKRQKITAMMIYLKYRGISFANLYSNFFSIKRMDYLIENIDKLSKKFSKVIRRKLGGSKPEEKEFLESILKYLEDKKEEEASKERKEVMQNA